MDQPRLAEVLGPVTGVNPPHGAPTTDLAARGYVCEEFLLDGTTVGYALASGASHTPDGRWDAVVHGEAPYRTRILVVRPADAASFNGTVVLNWQNVSAGSESGTHRSDELYQGYAWVGVSAQEVGIDGAPGGMERRMPAGRGLVDRDPERYGTLSHPGDQGSFEIFTQAARAVGPERSGPVDPMGGLDVRRVVATGASQSAMRLVAYANAVHQRDRAIDGFLLAVWEGRAPRLDDGALAVGARAGIRTDLGSPVLVVNSEFEAQAMLGLHQPETDMLRLWEVAGTAHAPAPARSLGHGDERGRTGNPLSYLPVHEMALRHLHRWLVDGVVAPSQPRIEIVEGTPVSLRRDDDGNAVGGIRLPELAAPTHEYRGSAFGTGLPPLFGSARPFTDDELRARYPDPAVYVEQWCRAVDQLVVTGALRPEDAEPMKDRADDVELPVD